MRLTKLSTMSNAVSNLAPLWGIAIAFLLAAPARGVVMTFGAAKDTTLIENFAGAVSNGGEDGFFSGRTNQFDGIALRRGLIAFDLSAIPVGATINSVSLRMTVVSAPNPAPVAFIELHRVLGRWGEGTVDPDGSGSNGDSAQPGDATWIHQVSPGELWDNPGGDFVPNSSAAQNVGAAGYVVTFTSTPPLVEDVQGWVDDRTLNYGWMVKGPETVSGTARKFAGRTSPVADNRPLLTIDFSLPQTRTPGDINGDGVVNMADVALLVAAYGETTSANNFDVGEFSGDGLIGLADMAILQRNLSVSGDRTSAAVPEPTSVALATIAAVCCAVFRCGRKHPRPGLLDSRGNTGGPAPRSIAF